MTRTTLRTTVALSVTLLAVTTGTLAVTAGTGAAERRTTAEQVDQLREDIAAYEDVEAALADGYVPAGPCAASPMGGMGVHYVNPDYAAKGVREHKPSVLLYEPTADGLRLAGAEFVVPDADQDLATDGDRPSLWGQPFDGPMPGHEPGMPVHYDLHVWTHETNPAGTFAVWNPAVSC